MGQLEVTKNLLIFQLHIIQKEEVWIEGMKGEAKEKKLEAKKNLVNIIVP